MNVSLRLKLPLLVLPMAILLLALLVSAASDQQHLERQLGEFTGDLQLAEISEKVARLTAQEVRCWISAGFRSDDAQACTAAESLHTKGAGLLVTWTELQNRQEEAGLGEKARLNSLRSRYVELGRLGSEFARLARAGEEEEACAVARAPLAEIVNTLLAGTLNDLADAEEQEMIEDLFTIQGRLGRVPGLIGNSELKVLREARLDIAMKAQGERLSRTLETYAAQGALVAVCGQGAEANALLADFKGVTARIRRTFVRWRTLALEQGEDEAAARRDELARITQVEEAFSRLNQRVDELNRLPSATSRGRWERFDSEIVPELSNLSADVNAALRAEDEEIRNDLGTIRRLAATTARVTWGVIALIGALGLGIPLLLRRNLLVPILRLREAADRIGAGEFSTRVPVTSRDEVGALEAGLNRMAESLSALTMSRDHVANILDSMVEAVFVVSPEGTISACNRAAGELLGVSAGELAGRSIQSILPDARPRGETVRGWETVCRGANGKDVPVRLSVAPLQSSAPGLPESVWVAEDLTIWRAAEDERTRLATAIDQAPEAIAIGDGDAVVRYVNESFEKTFGISREQVVGRTAAEVREYPFAGALFGKMSDAVRAGAAWSGAIEGRTLGTAAVWDLTVTPVRDSSGAIIGCAAVGRDVTELRRVEEQLRQSQKMEAVGRLAGGVAHDFNNLLTAILGYCDLLLARGAEDASRPYVEQIQRAGERAAGLTRQLLAFGRKQVAEPRIVDVNAMLEDLEPLLRRLIGEDVSLETSGAPHIDAIWADPHQLEQVVLNLVVNARDAMPRGGRLSIVTKNVLLGEDHLGSASGDYVLLSVTDTGVGMDPATRERAFEPFFTTKPKGKGTGLGLSTVYAIVEQSGGLVTLESEPGVGTTANVYLPRRQGETASPSEHSAGVGALGGSETVLLVEDEAAIRDMCAEALAGRGYRVLEASGAEEALKVLEGLAEKVDAVVTDVVMPGLSGKELASEVQARDPDVRVIYMSGYTGDVVVGRGVESDGASFLQKPFTVEALLRKVRELLDA